MGTTRLGSLCEEALLLRSLNYEVDTTMSSPSVQADDEAEVGREWADQPRVLLLPGLVLRAMGRVKAWT